MITVNDPDYRGLRWQFVVVMVVSLCIIPLNRFVVSCIPSWFWGPMVTLEDCLAAFFAADELKGITLCYSTVIL